VPRQVAKQPVHREDGTASVELIAVIPFLLLAILVAAQIAAIGQALWSASIAARAGARAALVGGDPAKVARQALPPALRPGSKIEDSGGVLVQVQAPFLPGGLPRIAIGAKAALGPDG